jgi:hypothetical protein
MALGQKIFWGIAFPIIFLVLLDFIAMLALDQNSTVIWGMIQAVFWVLGFLIGILKLLISGIFIYPLSLLISSVPDPFVNEGFFTVFINFIWDLLKSFFGLITYLITAGILTGGNFFFTLICFVVNLFIVNPSRKITDGAVSIVAYNLGAGTSPTGVIGGIELLSQDWFNFTEDWVSYILSTIKPPSVIFWEDIMCAVAPDWAAFFDPSVGSPDVFQYGKVCFYTEDGREVCTFEFELDYGDYHWPT